MGEAWRCGGAASAFSGACVAARERGGGWGCEYQFKLNQIKLNWRSTGRGWRWGRSVRFRRKQQLSAAQCASARVLCCCVQKVNESWESRHCACMCVCVCMPCEGLETLMAALRWLCILTRTSCGGDTCAGRGRVRLHVGLGSCAIALGVLLWARASARVDKSTRSFAVHSSAGSEVCSTTHFQGIREKLDVL